MAGTGTYFKFHGAFRSKERANAKAAKLGGKKKARVLGRRVRRDDYRYVVVTKR